MQCLQFSWVPILAVVAATGCGGGGDNTPTDVLDEARDEGGSGPDADADVPAEAEADAGADADADSDGDAGADGDTDAETDGGPEAGQHRVAV